MYEGIIQKYGSRLNIPSEALPISLCEGNTPLIPIPRLAREWNLGRLFVKYEGLNPSGSFKDRGMTTAITVAKHNGSTTVICASTGNTAASAASYAARAGMKCVVLIPNGKVALGKLAGAIAYGAQVIAIDGSFDRGLEIVQEISKKTPIALVNSVNPARLEGQKTAAWELCEQLGKSPDWLCLPVGNAGNISAYWMGFTECGNCPCGQKPQLLGVQAEGAAPLVIGRKVENPETIATAIRIGAPARGDQALNAIKKSNGRILAVSDEEILSSYRALSQLEGIFCEPSSAAGLAGLVKSVRERKIDLSEKTVVCVLTGHGLKDPDTAILGHKDLQTIPATTEALMDTLSL